MLKNSARNCTLKLSEIFLTAKFLYSEKSRLTSPVQQCYCGPHCPKRFEQVPGNWGLASVPFPTKGTHCEAIAGVALGSVKQLVLM
jgi:hypothetical protein